MVTLPLSATKLLGACFAGGQRRAAKTHPALNEGSRRLYTLGPSRTVFAMLVSISLVCSALFAADTTPVNLEKALARTLLSEEEAIGHKLAKKIRTNAKQNATHLLRSMLVAERKELSESGLEPAFLKCLVLVSIRNALAMSKPAPGFPLLGKIRKRLSTLMTQNGKRFSSSTVMVVLYLYIGDQLVTFSDPVGLFQSIATVGRNENALGQWHNLTKAAMLKLNSRKQHVDFESCIWGSLPGNLPDAIITLEWSNSSRLPVYVHSKVIADRKEKLFAFVNIPPGDYRLCFQCPQTKKKFFRKVTVSNGCTHADLEKASR